MAEDPSVYRTPYRVCPICGAKQSSILGAADCTSHPLWHPPLAEKLIWLRCDACEHVFTHSFYTDAGLSELFSKALSGQVAGGDLGTQRWVWSAVVQTVLRALPDLTPLFNEQSPRWLDVGCGAGGLVFTAEEFGFSATGLDLRAEAVQALRNIGYQARLGDLLGIEPDIPIQVISMADVLEHTPYPVAILRHAHKLLDARGVIFVSCPNRDCSTWKQMDARHENFYWREIEHYHNFSRKSLMWLLRQCGFQPVYYGVSQRYIACMEIVAVKMKPAEQTHPEPTTLSASHAVQDHSRSQPGEELMGALPLV